MKTAPEIWKAAGLLSTERLLKKLAELDKINCVWTILSANFYKKRN